MMTAKEASVCCHQNMNLEQIYIQIAVILISCVTLRWSFTSRHSYQASSQLISFKENFFLRKRQRVSRTILKFFNSNHSFLCKEARKWDVNNSKSKLITIRTKEVAWMETVIASENLLLSKYAALSK